MSTVGTPASPFTEPGLGAYGTMPPGRTYQTSQTSPAMSGALAEPAKNTSKHDKQSHKRKRDSPERNGQTRSKISSNAQGDRAPVSILEALLADPQADMSQVGMQLARHDAGLPDDAADRAATLIQNMPHLTVPQPTELSFQSSTNVEGDDAVESSFDIGADDNQRDHTEGTPYKLHTFVDDAASQLRESSGGGNKPAVGTEAWHKVRRDNHKEVERRRRETINEGINELAKIVPGCDKNKGAILTRGVQYITQLKENEKTNIQKWTMEKMCTEQAIEALSTNIETLKAELKRANQEKERWRKRCEGAGLGSKDGGTGGGDDNDDDDDAS